MQICEAIQERWENIVSEVPLLSSILSGDGTNELFKKSFGLVWNHFKKVMAEDQNKSTLLMLAPPYRKMELLECVLKILVAKEKANASFLTSEEIKSAWQSGTQVMLCFKCNGKVKRIAYTPQNCDIEGDTLWYRYGTSGKCALNSGKAIVLKAEHSRNDGKISGRNNLCVKGQDESLFGEEGFLTLNHAIVIVGNKNNETVELLKKMTIGGRNLWDAFSAVELGPNGSCINGAKGNGTPSIIVANDFERIRKYLKSVGGRYKQYYCVMCDDGYEFRANGTWGMGEQIAIRSSETIIKKLFKVDNPVEFKKYYELVAKNGCLFVWDRYFDRALRGEENLGKNVTVIKRVTMAETWSCLYDKIKSLKKSEMELQDAYRTICAVYRHLHLPKIDVQICREALESIETDDESVCEVKKYLETLLDYFNKNETEKMDALEQYLCQVAKSDWTVGVLSNREDYSCLSISKYAQAIPRIVKRVSRPEENPVVTTIAYKKMSTPVANRHWLFKNPNTKIQWFLYEDEVNALNALSDLLDDLETRHVMSRHDRANVLGVEKDLLYESVHATKNITKKDPSSEDVLKDISIQKILPESNQESLEDAMTRYFYHDVAARAHDNNKEISLGKSEIVIVKFGDNTHTRYTKSKKLLCWKVA